MEGLAGVNAASIEQQTGGEDRSPPGRAAGFDLIFHVHKQAPFILHSRDRGNR